MSNGVFRSAVSVHRNTFSLCVKGVDKRCHIVLSHAFPTVQSKGCHNGKQMYSNTYVTVAQESRV
jgi:hypothetical protein